MPKDCLQQFAAMMSHARKYSLPKYPQIIWKWFTTKVTFGLQIQVVMVLNWSLPQKTTDAHKWSPEINHGTALQRPGMVRKVPTMPKDAIFATLPRHGSRQYHQFFKTSWPQCCYHDDYYDRYDYDYGYCCPCCCSCCSCCCYCHWHCYYDHFCYYRICWIGRDRFSRGRLTERERERDEK